MPGMALNHVILSGRLGKDPELKYTASGKAICSWSFAVSRREGEEWVSDWYDCQAWDPIAERLATTLQKGQLVMVSGSLAMNTFTDKNGNERMRPRISVRSADPLLPSAKPDTAGPGKAQKQESDTAWD